MDICNKPYRFCNFLASAHITCRSVAEYMSIANKVKDFFHNEGIHSTTIQPEFIEDPLELGNCVLECGEDKECEAQRCCPEDARQRQRPSLNNERDKHDKSSSSSEELAHVTSHITSV